MANPFGVNQFEPTRPHGEVKRLQEAQKAAPLSGAPFSALHAPRRHQRHAAGQDRPRGGSGSQSALQALQEAPLPVINDPAPDRARAERVAQRWEAVARLPGASPLVKQYAREAREAVGGNLR